MALYSSYRKVEIEKLSPLSGRGSILVSKHLENGSIVLGCYANSIQREVEHLCKYGMEILVIFCDEKECDSINDATMVILVPSK